MQRKEDWVVITGCSTGIGLACVRKFVEEGYNVLATFRDADQGEGVSKELGPRCIPILLDLTSPSSILRASEEIKQLLQARGASLSCLINNAGIAVGGPLKYLPMEDIRHQFEVNFFGWMQLMQQMIPLLEQGTPRKKRIINMSSVSGRITNPFLGPYAASKYALEAISDAMRLELKASGIDVILIEPGPVDTPIWHKSIQGAEQYQNTEYSVYLARAQKVIETLQKNALPVEYLAKRVFESWQKSRPDIRVLVVKRPWLYRLFLLCIPDRLKDWMIIGQLRS